MRIIAAIVISLVLFQFSSAQEGDEEMKKLGLTQAEWQQYKASGMSEGKLKKLLQAGIVLEEYFQKPWNGMGISESSWISYRRDGWTNEEIRNKQDRNEYENGTVIISFFLPGYGHYRIHQKLKGLLFSSVAVGSISLYFLHTKKDDFGGSRHRYPAYLILLGADAVASAADVYWQTRNDANPELKRFSFDINPEEKMISLSMNFPIPR